MICAPGITVVPRCELSFVSPPCLEKFGIPSRSARKRKFEWDEPIFQPDRQSCRRPQDRNLREDDEINRQVGLQKLRKLNESDRCDIITEIQASNVAMAAVECLRRSKAFMLCSGAGVAALSCT